MAWEAEVFDDFEDPSSILGAGGIFLLLFFLRGCGAARWQ